MRRPMKHCECSACDATKALLTAAVDVAKTVGVPDATPDTVTPNDIAGVLSAMLTAIAMSYDSVNERVEFMNAMAAAYNIALNSLMADMQVPADAARN